MKQESFNKAWSKVIGKAWKDPVYKKRLLHEPQKVLKENGIDLHMRQELKITENTDKIVYLNLPANPGKELQDECLKKIAAGIIYYEPGDVGHWSGEG
jgi:hypothetical protein